MSTTWDTKLDQFSSGQSLSRVDSVILWTAAQQPPCPSPTSGVYSNSCPLSWWCHPTISSSVVPFSSCLQSFPASGSFQWVRSSHQVARVLELQLQHVLPMNIQDWFSLGWTGWIFFSPRDSQESSPTPQFQSINSSMLSLRLFYGTTLTSIHDYWKKHSFG